MCQNWELAISLALFNPSQPSLKSGFYLWLGPHQQILQRAKSLPEYTALFRQGHLLFWLAVASEVVSLFIKCLTEA